MIGNDSTVASLQSMVKNKRLPHTILFTGPSGCGKTTLARILVRELGCLDISVQERNCSKDRGIDTIRLLEKASKMSPVGPCRIWILDEAHQLTKDAQNAALKLLEDTPKHCYFFLCTTDPQKLIKTIRTRCTEMPVSLLPGTDIERLVRRVAKREKIELSKGVMAALVEHAQGSARVALVSLGKLQDLEPSEHLKALQTVSETVESQAIDLCRALIQQQGWGTITKILIGIEKEEPERIRLAVLMYARKVLLGGGDHNSYSVICAFESNFYDSKHAGLVRACYESTHGT